MEATQFLARDHLQARDAVDRIETTPSPQRGTLWRRFAAELRVHERVEHACLYHPLACDAGGAEPTLAAWEWRHAVAMGELDSMCLELDQLEPDDPAWLDRLQRIRARMAEHAREEEERIWPLIARVWGPDRRVQAGREMERLAAEWLGRFA